MQYNMQGVFLLNTYPGLILCTGGKHPTRDVLPLGHLLFFESNHLIFWMMSVTFTPFHRSVNAPKALKDSHWKSQSSCNNSLQHLQKWEKENKTQGWAPAGVISLTGVESVLAKKKQPQQKKLDSFLSFSQTESCQSFRTSLVLNKNFPSTLSTPFLYIHYSTLPNLPN